MLGLPWPLELGIRDLGRGILTLKIYLTTEEIFLNFTLCDLCDLEFVSDSEQVTVGGKDHSREKKGNLKLRKKSCQHVLKGESIY